MQTAAKILSGLMGLCVGDALGVPVEFTSRAELVKSPVTSMQGYGTWDVPAASYAEAVLKAVNLGGDTDTTAAVTGGLAGIYYGFDNIPQKWIEQIARKQEIIDLAKRLTAAIYET